MCKKDTELQLQLLDKEELGKRLSRIKAAMEACGLDSILISDNANKFYITGRVFSGFIYYNIADQWPVYAVKRPTVLHDNRMCTIKKPENLAEILYDSTLCNAPTRLGMELNLCPYSQVLRIEKALPEVTVKDASAVMRQARSVKTPLQVVLMKESEERMTRVYKEIPGLYRPGMSDIELQIEIERALRLEGCLGQFRISGDEMELFMGSLLVGENSDTPSPYDFAMGGAGMHPSLPVGADGTLIRPNQPVMVDMNGNFNGYMVDMTRCYADGEVPQTVLSAHRLSCKIVAELTAMARPGVEAKALYERAYAMAVQAGLESYFMGHRQHAGFVGHGIGIEVNEAPVLAPRSRDILEAGNTIALEPKFVLPGHGAVGIENTILVKESGQAETLTTCPEDIIPLS
ncbi:MAG: Xaa-Pro peptidase family protein [Muribaculaceae bacterium]|nr:Xaa-Pro peptidase family protein [Muribaculaceae bacterium]